LSSHVDEPLVQKMIAKRAALREEGRYEEADEVRGELRGMGVQVWDRDRVWTLGDQPPPRGGSRGYNLETSYGGGREGYRSERRGGGDRYGRGREEGNRYGMGRGQGGYRSEGRGGQRGYRSGGGGEERARIFVEGLSYDTTWQTLKDHFKNEGATPIHTPPRSPPPHSHPLCTSSRVERHEPRQLVSGYATVYASVSYDRERGRSKGCGVVEFETREDAERAIAEMTGSSLDGFNINCREDGKRKLDGGWGGAPRGGRDQQQGSWEGRASYARRSDASDRQGRQDLALLEHGHDYSRHTEDTTPLAAPLLSSVNKLLRDRLLAKLRRDFDTADDLWQVVHSRCAQPWGPSKGLPAHPHRLSSSPPLLLPPFAGYRRVGPAGEVSDELVDEMLLRRAEARRARDYSTADAIKAELSERYQVSVDDETKEWSCVQEASRANGQRKAGGRHDYTRAKECSVQLDERDLKEIDELLAERLALKKRRRFDEADEVQAMCGMRLPADQYQIRQLPACHRSSCASLASRSMTEAVNGEWRIRGLESAAKSLTAVSKLPE
ncbi:MAG: hypothetical protein SGPRY_011484, partial [Prymnesium sp.]